jgi:hypothetical protein
MGAWIQGERTKSVYDGKVNVFRAFGAESGVGKSSMITGCSLDDFMLAEG